jgi:hypothetical protein
MAVSVPEPGYDEIILTAPAGGQLCNSRACASAGRVAEVVVTYGVLADRGGWVGERRAMWPESWGRSVPMCTGCWEQTRPLVVESRPGLVIRDLVGAPAAAPPSTEGGAVPDPAPGRQGVVAVDGERWREAAQLRHDHAGWAVIWLAEAGEFRAYRRLPGARRDTALAAATASGLAAQIGQAEQPAHPEAARRSPR